jgi:hypothetical protein
VKDVFKSAMTEGMPDVWIASDPDGTDVSALVFDCEAASLPESFFIRAEIVQNWNNPWIVRVIGVEHPSRMQRCGYVVRELMSKGPTESCISELSPARKVSAILSTSLALDFAHANGIFHGSVVSNVLIDADSRAKLDFCGWPLPDECAVPERGAATAASDVFGLGQLGQLAFGKISREAGMSTELFEQMSLMVSERPEERPSVMDFVRNMYMKSFAFPAAGVDAAVLRAELIAGLQCCVVRSEGVVKRVRRDESASAVVEILRIARTDDQRPMLAALQWVMAAFVNSLVVAESLKRFPWDVAMDIGVSVRGEIDFVMERIQKARGKFDQEFLDRVVKKCTDVNGKLASALGQMEVVADRLGGLMMCIEALVPPAPGKRLHERAVAVCEELGQLLGDGGDWKAKVRSLAPGSAEDVQQSLLELRTVRGGEPALLDLLDTMTMLVEEVYVQMCAGSILHVGAPAEAPSMKPEKKAKGVESVPMTRQGEQKRTKTAKVLRKQEVEEARRMPKVQRKALKKATGAELPQQRAAVPTGPELVGSLRPLCGALLRGEKAGDAAQRRCAAIIDICGGGDSVSVKIKRISEILPALRDNSASFAGEFQRIYRPIADRGLEGLVKSYGASLLPALEALQGQAGPAFEASVTQTARLVAEHQRDGRGVAILQSRLSAAVICPTEGDYARDGFLRHDVDLFKHLWGDERPFNARLQPSTGASCFSTDDDIVNFFLEGTVLDMTGCARELVSGGLSMVMDDGKTGAVIGRRSDGTEWKMRRRSLAKLFQLLGRAVDLEVTLGLAPPGSTTTVFVHSGDAKSAAIDALGEPASWPARLVVIVTDLSFTYALCRCFFAEGRKLESLGSVGAWRFARLIDLVGRYPKLSLPDGVLTVNAMDASFGARLCVLGRPELLERSGSVLLGPCNPAFRFEILRPDLIMTNPRLPSVAPLTRDFGIFRPDQLVGVSVLAKLDEIPGVAKRRRQLRPGRLITTRGRSSNPRARLS